MTKKINKPELAILDDVFVTVASHILNFLIRELKQRQWRRQRERNKFAYLVGKNKSFARLARALFAFVHFFAVFSKKKQREKAKFKVL